MSDRISDSEDENVPLLTPSFVSDDRIRVVLNNLTLNQRNQVEKWVKSSAFSDALKPSLVLSDQLSTSPHFNDKANDGIEIELNDLLDTSHVQTDGRRGLRKRKFSSTHPYIADQAEWLDLLSVGRLNELYQDNPDIDGVLKFLNRLYLNKKCSYPHEERYKAKSFYSYVGMRSEEKDNTLKDTMIPSSFSQTSDDGENNYTARNSSVEEESDSEDDLINKPRHRHGPIIPHDDDDFALAKAEDNSDSENQSMVSIGEEDEAVVRVGGRVLREKNILKGVLPESAKRLDLYKGTYKSRKAASKVKKSEYRKGLAVKKYGATSGPRIEDSSFVDDLPQYSNENIYSRTTNFTDEESSSEILSHNFSRGSSVEMLGDRQELDDRIFNYNFQPLSQLDDPNKEEDIGISQGYDRNGLPPNSPRHYEIDEYFKTYDNKYDYDDDNNNYFEFDRDDGSVREVDYINPIFASRPTSKRNSVGVRRKRSRAGLRHRTASKRLKPSTQPAYSSRTGNTSSHLAVLKKKSLKPKLKSSKENRESLINLTSKVERDTKEVLKNDYQFRRDPYTATIVCEAESTRNFVRSPISTTNHHKWNNPLLISIPDGDSPLSQEYVTLINRLNKLKNGEVVQLEYDSVSVALGQKHSYLTVVDKKRSETEVYKILLYALKAVKNRSSTDFTVSQLISTMKQLINWFLILQEPPDDKSVRLLRNLLGEVSSSDVPEYYENVDLLPHSLLLYYFFDILLERSLLPYNLGFSILSDIERFASRYLQAFMKNFGSNYFTLSQDSNADHFHFNSFQLLSYMFRQGQLNWSNPVKNAVERTSATPIQQLESIHYLATCSLEKDDWAPLCLVYEHFKLEKSSAVHHTFLDIVYSLVQRNDWVIQDKLILLIYSSITARKFANFGDEWIIPELLGTIRSRDSIPQLSFFERFMHLLYIYVSDMPFEKNPKKLITKLIISSHYQYEKNKKHLVMFINRVNFILLLLQLSTIDLKSQLGDLIRQVAYLNDVEITELSIEAIKRYTMIAISKEMRIPIEAIIMLFTSISLSFITVPKIPRTWKFFTEMLQEVFVKRYSRVTLLAFVDLRSKIQSKSLPEKMAKDLCRLTYDFFNARDKNDLKDINLGDSFKLIKDDSFKLLHNYMGRFAINSKSKEDLLEVVVEMSLKTWVRCTYLSHNPNWNVLVLQQYPYLGNSESRERFSALFYAEVLRYTSMDQCTDHILVSLMNNLALYSTSKYFPLLLARLNFSDTKSHKVLPNDNNEIIIEIRDFRPRLAKDIIDILSETEEIAIKSKMMYIDEFLKRLERELDAHSTSTWFPNFCKQMIHHLQKRFGMMVTSQLHFKSLCSRLGIMADCFYDYDWLHLSPRERLVHLNLEIMSAIFSGKDSRQILDKFSSADLTSLLSELMCIYAKDIGQGNAHKWVPISFLCDYIVISVESFEIDIMSNAFKKFLLTAIRLKSLGVQSQEYQFFRYDSLCSVLKLLERAFLWYDGYKDQFSISSMIKEFIDLSNITLIEHHPSEIIAIDLEEDRLDDQVQVPADALEDKAARAMSSFTTLSEKLKNLLEVGNSTLTECLPFDL